MILFDYEESRAARKELWRAWRDYNHMPDQQNAQHRSREVIARQFNELIEQIGEACERRGAVKALRLASRDIQLDGGPQERFASEYLRRAAGAIEAGGVDISKA